MSPYWWGFWMGFWTAILLVVAFMAVGGKGDPDA